MSAIFAANNKIFAKDEILKCLTKKTPFVIHVPDLEKYNQKVKESPWFNIINEEEIIGFLSPLFELINKKLKKDIKIKEYCKSFLKLDKEFYSCFKGEFIYAIKEINLQKIDEIITKVKQRKEESEENTDPFIKTDSYNQNDLDYAMPHLILGGQLKEGEQNVADVLQKFVNIFGKMLNDNAAAEIKLVETQEDGVDLKIFQVSSKKQKNILNTLTWGEKDGIGFLGMPKQAVLKSVRDIKGGSYQPGLSSSATYVKAINKIGSQKDFYVHLFPADIVQQFFQLLGKKIPTLPNGMPTADFLNKLGFDELKGVSIGCDYKKDRLESESYTHLPNKRGIFSLLEYSDEVEPDLKMFDKNVSEAAFASMNMQKILENLVKLVADVIGQTPQQIRQMLLGMVQIDIDELIPYVGSGFIYTSEVVDNKGVMPMTDSTFGIVVKDKAQIQSFIESIKAKKQVQNLMEEIDYLGNKIYKLKNLNPKPNAKNPTPISISYSYIENYIVFNVGNTKGIKNIINNLKNPKKGLFDDEKIKNLLNEMPKDYISVSCQNLSKIFSNAYNTIKILVEKKSQQHKNKKIPFDFSKISLEKISKLFGINVACSYEVDEGYYGKSIMIPIK